MAGTIEGDSGELWSAAGWLFYDVLEALAELTPDDGVASTIRSVIKANLGWFSMRDLHPEQREQLRTIFDGSLLRHFENTLPIELPNRDGVLGSVRDLVRMVSPAKSTSPSPPTPIPTTPRATS